MKFNAFFTHGTRNSAHDLQGTFSIELILCAHTDTQRSAPDPQLLTPSPANNLKSLELVLYTLSHTNTTTNCMGEGAADCPIASENSFIPKIISLSHTSQLVFWH